MPSAIGAKHHAAVLTEDDVETMSTGLMTTTSLRRSRNSSHPSSTRPPKRRSSKRSHRPRSRRGGGVGQQQPTPLQQRPDHWSTVAHWIDTANDSRLSSAARIMAHVLAEHFDEHGVLVHVEDTGALPALKEHPEFRGGREGAEVPVFLSGLAALARAGFIDRQGPFVGIVEPARWNRGAGPTKLRD